jgi:hypothetical protein
MIAKTIQITCIDNVKKSWQVWFGSVAPFTFFYLRAKNLCHNRSTFERLLFIGNEYENDDDDDDDDGDDDDINAGVEEDAVMSFSVLPHRRGRRERKGDQNLQGLVVQCNPPVLNFTIPLTSIMEAT